MRASLLLVVLVLPAFPLAQTAAPAADVAGGPGVFQVTVRSDRELGGHVFIPTELVASPFPVTSFRVALLYGSGSAQGPTYDLDGNVVGTRDYTYAAWGQTFGYEQRLWEWLSLDVGLLTNLYTGLDRPSALVVGAEVGVGAWAGARAARQLGPVQVAATFQATWAPRVGLLVANAVLTAIQNSPPSLDGVSAYSKQNGWTLIPGVSAAWSPWRPLGIQASVDYQWLSQDTTGGGSVTGSAIDAAVAIDFDFGKISPVPVGVIAAYRYTDPLETQVDSTAAQSASLGIHYTGRPDLALGLDVMWRRFSLRPESVFDLESDAAIVDLGVEYFW
jgi:hypothetical protein